MLSLAFCRDEQNSTANDNVYWSAHIELCIHMELSFLNQWRHITGIFLWFFGMGISPRWVSVEIL